MRELPSCPICGAEVPLFAYASPETPVDGLWCPRCNGLFRRNTGLAALEAARTELPSLAPTSARGAIHGLPFELRVEPDGLILLTMATEIGRATWRATPEQLTVFFRAIAHVNYEASARQEHLRGADRWTFRRGPAPGLLYAKIMDQEAFLVPWTSGGRRVRENGQTFREKTCDGCGVELPKGTRGYRPGSDTRSNGMSGCVSWSTVRFCEPCVEAASEATERPRLVAIDGGKAKRA